MCTVTPITKHATKMEQITMGAVLLDMVQREGVQRLSQRLDLREEHQCGRVRSSHGLEWRLFSSLLRRVN